MTHKNAITEAREKLKAIKLQTEFFTQDGIGENVAKLTLSQIDILAGEALAKLDALIASVPDGLKSIDFSEGSDDPWDLCDTCVEAAKILHEATGGG